MEQQNQRWQVRSFSQLKSWARSLDPGYFALVMATGIVSTGLNEHGMPLAARALFWLNCLAYAWLLALSVLRLRCYPKEMLADLVRPGRSPAFLTLVASSCVLAAQCLLVVYYPLAARVMAVWGALCWLGLLYGFFFTVIARRVKGTFSQTIHGDWLIVIVATQSLAVITTLLANDNTPEVRQQWLFVAICLFLIGCAWYFVIITLITYRLVLLYLKPVSFTPTYWINMGVLAISTLSGSEIVLNAPPTGPLHELMPFVRGFTLFYWSMATWWIPLLGLLAWWRHGWSHVPVAYEVADWNMVFPLGMYTVGTAALARSTGLHYLNAVDNVMIYVAVLAWIWVAVGLIRRILGAKRVDGA
jgi:tellurite resistance protein TehA-like permease